MPSLRRPVFLDLRVIRLPVNAVVSILHRIAGVVLVLSLPLWVWLLELALRDESGFQAARAWLSGWGGWLALLALWALAHHLLAGVRLLLADLHLGMDRERMRQSAWAVLVADGLALPLLWGVLP